MIKYKIAYIFFLFAAILASCEKTLEIELDGTDELIVVNAVFQQDEILEVELTQSFSPFEIVKVNELESTSISLYVNGIFAENLIYSKQEKDVIGKYRSAIMTEVGKNYEVRVSDPELGEATANSSVPTEVFTTSESVRWNQAWDTTFGSIQYNFSLNLLDPQEENFYMLKAEFSVYKLNQATGEYEFLGFTKAQILTGDLPNHQLHVNNALVFKDEAFNNSSFNINGSVTTAKIGLPWDHEFDLTNEDEIKIGLDTVYFSLYNLSKPAYDFYSSYITKLESEKDIYSEPASIFSNIDGGIGIFAGRHKMTKALSIEY